MTFTGQADPSADDLATLVYSYDFDNDGTFEVTASTSSSATVPASFLADGPGTRTVRAVVADDDGGFTSICHRHHDRQRGADRHDHWAVDGHRRRSGDAQGRCRDPSPADMAGTFEFTVDWGDGTTPTTAHRTGRPTGYPHLHQCRHVHGHRHRHRPRRRNQRPADVHDHGHTTRDTDDIRTDDIRADDIRADDRPRRRHNNPRADDNPRADHDTWWNNSNHGRHVAGNDDNRTQWRRPAAHR